MPPPIQKGNAAGAYGRGASCQMLGALRSCSDWDAHSATHPRQLLHCADDPRGDSEAERAVVVCSQSVCAGGGPGYGARKQAKMPAKMESSESCLPACLSSSNGWAIHQEHSLRVRGAGMGDPEIAPRTSILAGKMTSLVTAGLLLSRS
eukprot:185187-Pelagomonas_calceolata.AAC.1